MWDSKQTQSNCDIREWIVADMTDNKGTPLAAGNPIFEKLMQPTPTSDLKINNLGVNDTAYYFKIYVKVGAYK